MAAKRKHLQEIYGEGEREDDYDESNNEDIGNVLTETIEKLKEKHGENWYKFIED